MQNNRLETLEKTPAVDPELELRVEKLEAAAEGNLYIFKENADEAYEKTVPADSMKWATLDKIGGKTIVMNQLVGDTYPQKVEAEAYEQTVEGKAETAQIDKIGAKTLVWNQLSNMLDKSAWKTNGTITNKDIVNGEIVISGGNIRPAYLYTVYSAVKDHVYIKFTDAYYVLPDDAELVSLPSVQGYNASAPIQLGSERKMQYSVFTETVTGEERIEIRFNDGYDSATIRCGTICVIDLTAMFGAGNEPTAEEFRAMFPADYYPYSEPTLMSFGTDKVVSEGRNLVGEYNIIPTTVFGIKGEMTDDNGIRFTGTSTYGSQSWTARMFGTIGAYDEIEAYLSVGDKIFKSTTHDELDGNRRYIFKSPFELVNGQTYDFVAYPIIVKKGVDVTAYSPYRNPVTLSYSSLVSKYFPTGMKSAGTVCDEIDLENRVAIQRVGSVDIGEIPFGGKNATGYFETSNYAIDVADTSAQVVGNIVCDIYDSRKAASAVTGNGISVYSQESANAYKK